jgi:sugar phosphate isomerase/epimerase
MHRSILALAVSLLLTSLAIAQETPADRPAPPKINLDPSAMDKLGWRLGCQAWTFRKLSLYETIDLLNGMGIRYIEMYPGQKLAPDRDVKADHNMAESDRGALIEKLKAADVTPVSYGVVNLPNDEAEARKVFEHAKALKLETIVSEPPPEAMPLLDKLANEYGINVAIHDHPKPSRYWEPETVLKAVEGTSKRCGACADIGHWTRSGLVSAESLKKLEGRVIEFHFKDIDEKKDDVVWTTGKVGIRAVMEEMKRQNYTNKPLISIEYEKGEGQELIDNVAKSVEMFNEIAKELAQGTVPISAPGDAR